MANLPFPGGDVVDVGTVRVHWLSPDVDLPVEALLVAEDRERATGIKAEMRRNEFVRSRAMIRHLTGWKGTLAKTATGAPGWPDGWCGSLTHKDGWVGVALKRIEETLSFGIDGEDVARLKPGFESKILNASESERVDQWARNDGARRLEILAGIFSFKESLFKAIYPLGAKMFYFHDAEVTQFDQASGRIAAKLGMATSAVTPAEAVVAGQCVSWKRDGRHFVLTSAELHRITDGSVRDVGRPFG